MILGKIEYNSKHKEVLVSFLLENPNVVPGKMFEYPAYYVGGKLYASFYEEGIWVKVPENMLKHEVHSRCYN